MNLFRLKSRFARHVLTLVSGTAIAQAIPIAIAPVLCRLYTPADFGILAIYMAVSGILTVAVTGSYQLAILLPADDGDAANIFVLTLVIAVGFSLLTLPIMLLFGNFLATLIGEPAIAQWLYFVPLSLLCTGFYQASYYWFNRRQAYRRIAISRVVQSIVLATVSILMGWLAAPTATGLLLGLILGQIAATVILGIQLWQQDSFLIRQSVSRRRMAAQARRYCDFPKFSVPADTINLAAAQMPVLLMTGFFGPAVVGFYALTQRVLGAPVSIIASAIADVFKQKASVDFNATGNCRETFVRTFRLLVLLSVVPFTALFFTAPMLFEWGFGKEWRTAGFYAQVMALLFLLRFIVSPLSRTLYVAEKQRYDLMWQIGLACVTTSAVVVGGLLDNPVVSIGLFTAAYCGMYVIYLLMAYKFSQGKSPNAVDETVPTTARAA